MSTELTYVVKYRITTDRISDVPPLSLIQLPQGIKKPSTVSSTSTLNPYINFLNGTSTAVLTADLFVANASPDGANVSKAIGFKRVEIYEVTADGQKGSFLWGNEYFDWGLPIAVGIPYDVLKERTKIWLTAEAYDASGTKYTYDGVVELPSVTVLAGEDKYDIKLDGTVDKQDVLSDPNMPDYVLGSKIKSSTSFYGLYFDGTVKLVKPDSTGTDKLEGLNSAYDIDKASANNWIDTAQGTLKVLMLNDLLISTGTSGYAVKLVQAVSDPSSAKTALTLAENYTFGGNIQVKLSYDQQSKSVQYRASVYKFVPDQNGKTAVVVAEFKSNALNDSVSVEYQPQSYEGTVTAKELYDQQLSSTGKKGLFNDIRADLKWNGQALASFDWTDVGYTLDEALNEGLITVVKVANTPTSVKSDYFPLRRRLEFEVGGKKFSFTYQYVTGAVTLGLDLTKPESKVASKLPQYSVVGLAYIAGKDQEVATRTFTNRLSAVTLNLIEAFKTADGSPVTASTSADNSGNFTLTTLAPKTKLGLLFPNAGAVLYKAYADAVVLSMNEAFEKIEITDDSGNKLELYGNKYSGSLKVADDDGSPLVELTTGQKVQFKLPETKVSVSVDTANKRIVLKLSGTLPDRVPVSAVLDETNTEDGKESNTDELSLGQPHTTPAGVPASYVSYSAQADMPRGAEEIKVTLKLTPKDFDPIELEPEVQSESEDYFTVENGVLKAKYQYSVKVDGDYVLVSAKAPVLKGSVIYKADAETGIRDSWSLTYSKTYKLCQVGGGKRYSTLTVAIPLFSKTVVKQFEVPSPSISLNGTVLSAVRFGWACEIKGTISYESLPSWPDLKSSKYQDSFSLKQPDYGQLYPAVDLTQKLSALPKDEMVVDVEGVGRFKYDMAVRAVGEWPNKSFVHPLAGKNYSWGCLGKNGLVDCKKTKFNEVTGYALFRWADKDYAYEVGKPTLQIQFASIEELGTTAVLSINVVPLFLGPCKVQFKFYKPVEQIEVMSETAGAQYSKNMNLFDIYRVEVSIANKWGNEIFSAQYNNYGFKYGELKLNEDKTVVHASGVVVARGLVALKVVAEQSGAQFVLAQQSGEEIATIDEDIAIPEGVTAVRLVADVSGAEEVLAQQSLSKTGQIIEVVKKVAPIGIAFVLAGGVTYLLTTRVIGKKRS